MIVNGICRPEQTKFFITPRFHADAKEICRHCPAINSCLKFALKNEDFEPSTVYGGFDGRQRKALVMSGGSVV